MGFQQGVSGLNAASRNLDVIGNNIANANTVGAKLSRAEFADVYASASSNLGSNAVGIGVRVDAVTQQFTQGNLRTTENPLDMAINGRGFFRMSNNGDVTFTRAGQFQLDQTGFVVNSQGARLTGFGVDATGQIATGVPTDIQLPTGGIAPQVTSTADLTLNLDAASTVPASAFAITDASSYTGATSLAVFDGQGNEQAVSLYFRRTATANEWEVFAAFDGQTLPLGGPPAPVGNVTFSPQGTLVSPAAPAGLSLNLPFSAASGGPSNVALNFPGTTQFGSPFGVTQVSQNGFAAGRLSGFSITPEGAIQARFSNGQTQIRGQVALADFRNPQGLVPIGNNQWAQTLASGQPSVSAPGSGNLGVVQGGALEESNVELTQQLVDMITAQRSYQANAQTIQAQDQIMQTLVNL
ncbi:MAG: flagellar hook protein FlgE [Burkholderiaceae bacterium]|jgi:flagellar hook protein FlgE|nr:flagellar hook protein FlgE [Burkholderiaceae bacterium]MDZ4145124.1 flagellar hook protein FlgE [Burkholderiales bacterium]PKO42743.1 MAG: flagellar hook protein FlgE [Betaproteobacteria bacterium HGW-Betaproteobacteria-3]